MAAMTIQDTAYSKILLHCAKYPWDNVFGILLCNDDISNEITDVVPLFHTPLVASALEAALLLINQHCLQTKKRVCGGYYSGEEPSVPKKVVAQIAIKTKLPVYFLSVLKEKVATEDCPFQLLLPSGSDWKLGKIQAQTDCAKNFANRLSKKAQTKLADFDDCLEDTTKDFRNSDLLK